MVCVELLQEQRPCAPVLLVTWEREGPVQAGKWPTWQFRVVEITIERVGDRVWGMNDKLKHSEHEAQLLTVVCQSLTHKKTSKDCLVLTEWLVQS